MNIDLSLIGTYAIGIITLIIVAKLILTPFKLLLTLIWNALLGGALLWGVNYFTSNKIVACTSHITRGGYIDIKLISGTIF